MRQIEDGGAEDQLTGAIEWAASFRVSAVAKGISGYEAGRKQRFCGIHKILLMGRAAQQIGWDYVLDL